MANIKVLDRLKPCEDILHENSSNMNKLFISCLMDKLEQVLKVTLTRSRIQTGLGLVLPGFWGQIPRNRRCSK